MTTPTTTTPTAASATIEMTAEQRQQLEVIASTYPTQDDLIVATAVFFEHKLDDENTKPVASSPMFVIGGDKSYSLDKEAMDTLVAMYATNDKLLKLMEKVGTMKPVTTTKAKSGNGCAYTQRNLD